MKVFKFQSSLFFAIFGKFDHDGNFCDPFYCSSFKTVKALYLK